MTDSQPVPKQQLQNLELTDLAELSKKTERTEKFKLLEKREIELKDKMIFLPPSQSPCINAT